MQRRLVPRRRDPLATALTPPAALPSLPRMFVLRRVALLFLALAAVQAQFDAPFKVRPQGHEENRARVARIHQDELRRFAGDTNLLILPGIVADRRTRRVEVRVERSAVGPGAPCEFLVVGESSDHGYEALLIAFARPSDLHQAVRFIGTEPGQSYHPPSHRFWAKGERFLFSLLATNRPPVRVENLLIDRRTGSTLPPDGYLFTGSRRIPAPDDPRRSDYAADTYPPRAIASLFSAPDAVFEVPRTVSKESIYRHTTVNPEFPLSEGELLTLAIEPALPAGFTGVKELVLQVDAAPHAEPRPGSKVEALARLRVQLLDGSNVLNPDGSLVSMVGAIAALDRQKQTPHLTLRWAPEVRLASAQALAEILASLDREQGIRIEPPLPGDPYYRAFTPDRQLLDRTHRLFHPLELAMSRQDGRISGRLLRVDSIWKEGASRAELQFLERPIRDPADLRRELDADREGNRSAGRPPRPNAMVASAPSDLALRELVAFLEPVLTHQTALHLLVGEPLPPAPSQDAAP